MGKKQNRQQEKYVFLDQLSLKFILCNAQTWISSSPEVAVNRKHRLSGLLIGLYNCPIWTILRTGDKAHGGQRCEFMHTVNTSVPEKRHVSKT